MKQIVAEVTATGLNYAALREKPVSISLRITDGPAAMVDRYLSVPMTPEQAVARSLNLGSYALEADYASRTGASFDDRDLFARVVRTVLTEALGDAVRKAEQAVAVRTHNRAVERHNQQAEAASLPAHVLGAYCHECPGCEAVRTAPCAHTAAQA